MSDPTPRHRATRTGFTVSAAIISSALILASLGGMAIITPLPSVLDKVAANGSASSQTVSQLQLVSYCPARMSLADSGSFGDSEFQPSAGNIASAARYAAFGSIYQSSIGTLAHSGDLLPAPQDDPSIITSSGDVDKTATLMQTHLLESASGTGTVASSASWATDGDLKGVAASSCTSTALEHEFLLPATTTGTTQQLVIANPSNKSTTVQLQVWGTSHQGALTLSTGENVSVKASGESVLDLSAAASDQNGLYVKVSSEQAPVAASVRVVTMDGLVSHGTEYATPVSPKANVSVMPGVQQGDRVNVIAYSDQGGNTTFSWITEQGERRADTKPLDAGKVTIVDLGEAPEGALALRAVSDTPSSMTMQLTRSGKDRQEDFALVNAGVTHTVSAVAVPGDLNASLTLVNSGNDEATGTITAYDSNGAQVGKRDVTLGAYAATSMDASVINAKATVLRLDIHDNGQIVWGARVSDTAVHDADLAGLAWLPSSTLDASTTQIKVEQDPTIVR